MERIKKEDNSRKVLAIVLIIFGLMLVLKQSGVTLMNPFFHVNTIFTPFRAAFHGVGHVLFSWPFILILVGLILMAGKRSAGLILLIIGGIFIIPKLIFISGAALLFFFPLILIGLGIALVARML